MRDYEELVMTLRRQCADMDCGNCNTCVKQKAADAIEELCKKREAACWGCQCEKMSPPWISVEERLPGENDRYIAVAIEPWFGTTIVDIMRWNCGVWMYDGRRTDATVTHWMPLPEPPKEVDE